MEKKDWGPVNKIENFVTQKGNISREQATKWFESAQLSGKKLDKKEIDKIYRKFKPNEEAMDKETFEKFLGEVGKQSQTPLEELKTKFANAKSTVKDNIVGVLGEASKKGK